jgi:predicted nucleic acid-binding protein
MHLEKSALGKVRVRKTSLNCYPRVAESVGIYPICELLLGYQRYAVTRAQVESKGRAKSDFDLLIACCALEHNSVLVTNDGALKDNAIDDLVVQDWLE